MLWQGGPRAGRPHPPRDRRTRSRQAVRRRLREPRLQGRATRRSWCSMGQSSSRAPSRTTTAARDGGAGCRIMAEARQLLEDFALLVNISAGYPGHQGVGAAGAGPLPRADGRRRRPRCSAPEFYPYLQSGQLLGLLGGMAGAAEYEKLDRRARTRPRKGMDAQSLAHLFIVVLHPARQRGLLLAAQREPARRPS